MATSELPKFTPTFHRDTYPALDPTNPKLSASGKIVLITGGGRGIGVSIAKSWAKARAAHIILVGRNASALASTKAQLEQKFPSTKFHVFSADVTNLSAVENIFETAKASIGEVNVVISNAGYLSKPTFIGEEHSTSGDGSVEDWWRVFEVNVMGFANISRAFLRHISKKPAEAAMLINMSSAMSHLPAMPGHSAYISSKEAAVKLSESIRAENSLDRIRIVNLHPGLVDTEMYVKSGVTGYPIDTVELPADFSVWLGSKEAAFLDGRYVWSNWDVEELKMMEEEIQGGGKLNVGLIGWPRM